MQGSELGNQCDVQARASWLNRNVFVIGLTSLLSDTGHEMATAVLPAFLAVLGVPAAALGVIEGIADATSSFVKLWAGWISDRLGHRKAIAVGGYVLTGLSKSLFAFAYGWPLILVGRVVGWFGRGIRAPLRNAILADSVPDHARGKAFGFERAGDTLGAVLGPLLAFGVLTLWPPTTANPSGSYRTIFLLTLIPGLSAALAFGTLVRERRRAPSPTKFTAALRNLPQPFRRFLLAVGVFGMGDFAHTLLILAATELLTPSYGTARAAQIAILLYVVHNVFYASASYPAGALSDRWGRKGLLVAGYVLGAITALGCLAAFAWSVAAVPFLLAVFAAGGIYVAVEEALEAAMTADLVPPELRGTAFGALGTVNGIGDLFASAVVGVLWTAVSPVAGFAYAAALMLGGGAALARLRSSVK
jgi:MFS family permease